MRKQTNAALCVSGCPGDMRKQTNAALCQTLTDLTDGYRIHRLRPIAQMTIDSTDNLTIRLIDYIFPVAQSMKESVVSILSLKSIRICGFCQNPWNLCGFTQRSVRHRSGERTCKDWNT